MTDGFTVMIDVAKYYKNIEGNLQIMNNIIDYNMADCEVLWEILMYLRKNHTGK